jgi:hypothetical protein
VAIHEKEMGTSSSLFHEIGLTTETENFAAEPLTPNPNVFCPYNCYPIELNAAKCEESLKHQRLQR